MLSHKEIRDGTALALGYSESGLHFSLEASVNTRSVLLSSAMLFPLLISTPAHAQRVTAEIRIGGGPVAGRIILGDGRGRYESRPRAIRQVEWIRGRDNRRFDWFRRFGQHARAVIVFYDRRDDQYYFDRFRPGLLEIRIYERDGRFYRFDDDRFDRRDDRRDDQWNDRRDDRQDNRRNGRREDRRDDRRDRYGDRYNN